MHHALHVLDAPGHGDIVQAFVFKAQYILVGKIFLCHKIHFICLILDSNDQTLCTGEFYYS